MVKPVDIGNLSQKVKEDLEKVPLDREALRKSLDEIKNALVLQQPLVDNSVLRAVADDVLKDMIMNTMHELSSVPSLFQQSPLSASIAKDFVFRLSGGSALCATVLGFDETNPFGKAPIPFLRKLDTVEMLQPLMSVQETKFSFIHNRASSCFLESVKSSGFSVAASLNYSDLFSSSASYSSESKIRHSSGQASKTEMIYLYKVGFYPIGAFRLPLNGLEMSEEAQSELLNVTNESQAENFLRHFGSHISADLHHYGGLMIYRTEMQRKVDGRKSEDIATAEQKFEASISGGFWKIQAGAAKGFRNSSSHYTVSDGSSEKLSSTIHLDTYGPSTSDPSLFQEILRRDRTTNYLIDKGSFKVLRPVWEIARRTNDPKIEKASKMLLEVWLKKTQQTSNTMIAELRKQYCDQLPFELQRKFRSKGLQTIDRLNSKLVYFFKEVTSEAFRWELREEIYRSVTKKNWYNSTHHLQGHIDLFLMEIEESSGIRLVLDWISRPSELRRSTVLSLVEREIKDTEEKWTNFKDRTEQCIIIAFEESKNKEGCKVMEFINVGLSNLLGDAFLSNFFKQALVSQFKVYFDESELRGTNHEFIQLRLNSIVKALHSSQVDIDEKKLASEVLGVCDFCEEHCKFCRGLCFKKRMHDGYHNTCHQPLGLVGCPENWNDGFTSPREASSRNMEIWNMDQCQKKQFHFGYDEYYFLRILFFSALSPDAISSDYRHYLICKYNDVIASYHNKKPTMIIPHHCEKDVNRIRENIKCRILYSEDYPSP